ncbi:MAG: cell envelope integrity protein TolA [Comamonadaceae bacterium]|nr:cell envelope integrity protein TolA [Comamonadaceae bacterium]
MRAFLVLMQFLVLGLNAQAQEALTVFSGEKVNIPIRVKADSSCNVEISIKDRKEQRQAEPPNFDITFEFQAQELGVTEITWQGRYRSRGLNSRPACPGSGSIKVTTIANTEQRKAEWARVFAPLRPEQRECLQLGLVSRGVRFESMDPQASLDSPTSPAARDVFTRCDSFFVLPRVWANNDPADYPCTLPGGIRSRCTGTYAERLPDGRLAAIGRDTAMAYHFEGKSWTTSQRETDQAREARERTLREEQARRDAEVAARREAQERAMREEQARKDAEAEARRVAQERERQARLEAQEAERRFKESPEYKRQQAELERRRVAEVLAAEEKARQEKEEREQAARKKRQEDDGFRGQHMNVLACFAGRVGTELELRNGPRYGLYKVHEIGSLGQETREGLRINLQKKFELKAQNSDETLILGVKIVDRSTNETLFEKQVGRFGVISIKE